MSRLPLVGRPAPRLARPTLSLALALLFSLAACDGGGTDGDAGFSDDLVGRFEARDRYVPLADALELTGLDDELRSGGPFTILAPTRIAFAYVGTDFSPVLFAAPQRETLARVLRHHVVRGRLGPEAFTDGAALTALDGTTLTVRRIGPVATVNGVTVDLTDPTEATNGVAYPLADVLFDVLRATERVALSPLLSTFRQGTQATGVLGEAEGLDRLTVLAPTNDAFLGLPGGSALLLSGANAEIYRRALRAHVLPGDVDLDGRVGQTVTTLDGEPLAVTRDPVTEALYVDGIRVLKGEATADGRLYVLGEPVLSVLSLDERVRIRSDLSRYEADLGRAPAVRARLRDRADGLTLFAPSNFFYSGRGDIEAILAEPNQTPLVRRLTAVRVVVGEYTRADLVDGLQLTTLDGTVLLVRREGDAISVDGRPLPAGEPARAANGLLYTADIRITPNNLGLVETIIVTDRAIFFRAIQRAGLETAYRTTVRTAFAPSEAYLRRQALEAIKAGPPELPFVDRPDLGVIMRRTATTAFLPVLEDLQVPTTFTVLSGEARQVVIEGCFESAGTDVTCTLELCNEPDEVCTYNFERRPIPNPTYPEGCGPEGPPEPCLAFLEVQGTRIFQGETTSDGTAVLHTLQFIDEPPPPGAPRGPSRPLAGRRRR